MILVSCSGVYRNPASSRIHGSSEPHLSKGAPQGRGPKKGGLGSCAGRLDGGAIQNHMESTVDFRYTSLGLVGRRLVASIY